jgi:hypothetical protein
MGHTLRPTGGIRPPLRKRSRLPLSLAEREEIAHELANGGSMRSIAARLGRAPSMVCPELPRRFAVMLNLNTETVRFIIDKAQAFQMPGEDEADDSIEGPDPTYAELRRQLRISSQTNKSGWSPSVAGPR